MVLAHFPRDISVSAIDGLGWFGHGTLSNVIVVTNTIHPTNINSSLSCCVSVYLWHIRNESVGGVYLKISQRCFCDIVAKLWMPQMEWSNSKIYANSLLLRSGSSTIRPIYPVPDNKVHVANMGSTWVLSVPDGPHVGPMNLAIRVLIMNDATSRSGIDEAIQHHWVPGPFSFMSIGGTKLIENIVNLWISCHYGNNAWAVGTLFVKHPRAFGYE